MNPRKDRYSRLHELDDFHGEPMGVDISSLEGLPFGMQFSGATPDEEKESYGDRKIPSASTSDSSLQADNAEEPTKSVGVTVSEQRRTTIISTKGGFAAVDLSSLEGLGHLYPTSSERPNWRPFSMKNLYIIMLIVVSLTLAGVQEYLCQKSQRLEKQGSGLVRYNQVENMPVSEFFCWKYLPTIVMVSYGVLWQIAAYEIQRLEPYYQLSQPTGNTAAKSLNLDYVTIWSYFVPYKAFKYRHWLVFVCSIGTILATTAAPSLQNPSLISVKNPHCHGVKDCGGDFANILRIQPIWSRLMTACLILVAILSTIMLFMLQRKSGLLSDPRGIAGVASMATKSHILRDFDGMDESLHDDIHKKLRHRRYILYKSTIWQGEFTKQTEFDPPELRVENPNPNPQPIILRTYVLLAFIAFMVVCLPFIPAISYTSLNKITRTLPWLPVLLSTLIKQIWATLEFNVKMLEPFYTLSKGNAHPEQTLTLDYQGTPYGLLPCKALLNRHYLVALIGIGSILGDILTITFSSLSLASETPSSFYSSSILSTTIVSIMIFSAFIAFLRRRRPFMPRQPSTIASILAFIHQSRMLDDFVDTELYTHSQMQDMLIRKGKTYGLGWFRGRDNRPHCAIDQEPMLSRYRHGVSYIRAQAPWEENIGV
ncbi:hypothetical protein ASPWEDRAFT_50034 [Aspergillus wentii DTO 134E9]|uniref:Uncharacterized protein n=1 Tax=Aspergillus wentii DTO 134E9 TaxID=1073089 RepID=A0A1L9RNV2_ASPWE|nr:uncharacterized protein ASPWEDRAFT_50034 [Aspergillus wentii DTO 134E9]OJJ36572.1 hypothetical protein ASPWEDRAFT_50034 [Aspergillus wentii DTO 134E9]